MFQSFSVIYLLKFIQRPIVEVETHRSTVPFQVKPVKPSRRTASPTTSGAWPCVVPARASRGSTWAQRWMRTSWRWNPVEKGGKSGNIYRNLKEFKGTSTENLQKTMVYVPVKKKRVRGYIFLSVNGWQVFIFMILAANPVEEIHHSSK